MIWRLLDAGLCRLVGRLLRLSPVEPVSRPCNPGCDCSDCYGADVTSQDEEALRRRIWPESPR